MLHGFQKFLCAKFDSNRRYRGTGEGAYTRSGPRCTLNGLMYSVINYRLVYERNDLCTIRTVIEQYH